MFDHLLSDLYIAEDDGEDTSTKAASKKRDKSIKNEPTHKRVLCRGY